MPKKKKKGRKKAFAVHLLDKTITKLFEAKIQCTKNAYCIASGI